MRLEFSVKAEEDLIRIYAYGVATFGESQAERYYAALEASLRLLAEQPFLARERREFTPPVRVHFHGRHVIVYIVGDASLLIVRVLADRQDWPQILSDG